MTQTPQRPRLEDRYEATSGRVQLTGIHALTRLPIEQHRRDLAAGLDVATLITGYEGSPLAGYDLELLRNKKLLDPNQIVVQPALNEESAATALQGSQLVNNFEGAKHDGVVGLWYGKAPGLDRAADAIRHGALMGAHRYGGAVLFVGDDPAAKSSTLPCSSEFAMADFNIPFLDPADSQDVIDLGLHAIELSRITGLWTGVKIATAVADGSSPVDLDRDRPAPIEPQGGRTHQPTSRLLQPHLTPLEQEQYGRKTRLAKEYARLNGLNRIIGAAPGDRIGIVASGRTFLELTEALRRLGIDADDLTETPIRLLRMGMVFPVEESVIGEFADGLDEILVVEEKRSFLEAAIKDILYATAVRPRVTGKQDPAGKQLVQSWGELDSDAILAPLRRRLTDTGALADQPDPAEVSAAARAAAVESTPATSPGAVRTTSTRIDLPLVQRAPYFCSGCPHNSSTRPIEGSLTGAGIGCHALVLMMDPRQVGEVTGLAQMGGEGLQWVGMAPFTDRDHYVQNLGDGTFDHSGSLAIRGAVASGANITYKLLYNSAVAMTGGQRAIGGMGVPQIVDVLRAEGVAKIIVTTEDRSRYRDIRLPADVPVWDRSRLDEAQRVLADTPGVTVLVHDQQCATEKRRGRKRGTIPSSNTRVFINERICEGCGDCGVKSNCLSVHPVDTEFGRKTRIHQSSCNLDLSCLDGDCPAFMTVTVPDGSKPQGSSTSGPLDTDAFTDPQPLVGADEFAVRLMGIGGTGIVTVSQLLANAGLIAGWQVRSLDQTGLAQKGGAVVSDVRFARRGTPTSSKIGQGECDLYLGCDHLVSADPRNLTVTDTERTIAVLNTSRIPTGQMVSDVAADNPSAEAVLAPVVDATRAEHAVQLDARDLSTRLFGNDQYANVLMLGAAYQQGAIPLPAEAIEEAIRLNGVAVEANLQAFRRGRQAVAEPQAPALHAAERRTGPRTLDETIALRVDELTAYADQAYAGRFADRVARARAAESELGNGSTAFTEAVARHLYKLMAYKDEYEVARLALLPELDADLERTFGPGAEASWKLHPPMLRALGMDGKITLGPKFAPALKALRSMKRLRGTKLDVFGIGEVRRVERELITEYEQVIDALIDQLTTENLDLAVQIAELPDVVRGYEEIKLDNVRRYRERLAELRLEFERVGRRTNRV
ncbi:2-oxoacid ferredoxin oxidoreductase [Enemella evansiae]|uniref:indolepyruvate ferredoxin oxidoreductase family protein n=1 Tax=Enemella evansiae TaxID=2016499 RepID=UPI000B97168C|nr:indolepyruvate ferredoxin oxidoreductase family protein [Enemella evansiae]OYO15428.1 2-oxoacid ferredoxin oxidoreductase [Enemella evansiae]